MPFASIYCTIQRYNPWKKNSKKLRIEGVENLSFFARMGQNFDDYPGFQPKTTFLYYYAHLYTLQFGIHEKKARGCSNLFYNL
jgi:hypothetical protein